MGLTNTGEGLLTLEGHILILLCTGAGCWLDGFLISHTPISVGAQTVLSDHQPICDRRLLLVAACVLNSEIGDINHMVQSHSHWLCVFCP